MSDEFADETVDVSARNLGHNIAMQAVDLLRQLDGHAQFLAQADDRLRSLRIPAPTGYADTDGLGRAADKRRVWWLHDGSDEAEIGPIMLSSCMLLKTPMSDS